MKKLPDITPRVHSETPADSWPDWTDIDRWEPDPEPSEDHASGNGDDHPTIDDDPGMAADEAACRAEEDRRHAADPTDEDFDRWAEESAAQDQLERGIRMF